MFRAAHRSSLRALNCICSLWFICPYGDRPLPRLRLELLMMSGVPLETFWAFKKLWNNKLYYKAASCWYFYWVIYNARIHEYQVSQILLHLAAETVSSNNKVALVCPLPHDKMCWKMCDGSDTSARPWSCEQERSFRRRARLLAVQGNNHTCGDDSVNPSVQYKQVQACFRKRQETTADISAISWSLLM